MDLAAQIKNNLISRIKNSQDLNFLKALQTIFFDTSEQELYELSLEQKDAISVCQSERSRRRLEKATNYVW